MKRACGIGMLDSYRVKLLIFLLYTFASYIIVVHMSNHDYVTLPCDYYIVVTALSPFSFQTCYKCCRGDLCNSYIPGLDFSGSDSYTLSIGGVLMACVVLATLSSTVQ